MMTLDEAKLMQRHYDALKVLVDKLTAMEAHPSFQGIWAYLAVHGYRYTGPDWRDALADARLALSSPPPLIEEPDADLPTAKDVLGIMAPETKKPSP